MEAQIPRIPPHHPDAEKSILGCMIVNNNVALSAIESLTADDFYDPVHREIFDAMAYLCSLSRPVDLVTLEAELNRRGKLEGVGGFPYLMELSRFVPSTANSQAYIRIVDEKSTLRKLINASEQISGMSYTADMETPDILAASEKLIYDITMRKGGAMLEPIQPILLKTYDTIEELARNKGQIAGVPTGYTELDNLLTGMHGGELLLVAARPSMGKTAFGLNVVQNAAIRAGKKCAIFSLEMPSEQLALRMMCTEARVNMQNVRRGLLDSREWIRLGEAMGQIGEANIFIDATSGITVPEMRSKLRRLQMEHGVDLVMLDYMQLMTATGRFGSRQEEVASISRSLKTLAQELNVPIMALSQLSRSPAGRSDHRPMLNDIRDSGAIEQDADVVMFVHREDYYDKETELKNIAEIIVAKQRNGALGTVNLGWQGDYTWFADLSRGGGTPEPPPV